VSESDEVVVWMRSEECC